MGKGGRSSPTTTTTTTTDTTVNVSTTLTGPPINIAVGSDFLKPVAEAILPVAHGIEGGIQTLSNQAASIANQAESISKFTHDATAQLNARQGDLETLVKLMLGITVAGLGLVFLQSQRRAA